jgi:hypothetical protein
MSEEGRRAFLAAAGAAVSEEFRRAFLAAEAAPAATPTQTQLCAPAEESPRAEEVKVIANLMYLNSAQDSNNAREDAADDEEMTLGDVDTPLCDAYVATSLLSP